MRIKVCGITREEDARLACELGAWAVGFIFAKESPRYISPQIAAKIAAVLPSTVEKVGVFVDATSEEVAKTRTEVGLTLVQLHGRETPEMVKRIGGRVIKAVRPRVARDIDELRFFSVESFLIDGAKAGEVGDWKLAALAKNYGAVILAGGISADNLSEALRQVLPFAVDLSSRLESSPGVKDAQKMKALFAIARDLGRKST